MENGRGSTTFLTKLRAGYEASRGRPRGICNPGKAKAAPRGRTLEKRKPSKADEIQ